MQDVYLLFITLFIALFVIQVEKGWNHKDIIAKLKEIERLIKEK